MKPLYLFYHIPKTGGQSLRYILDSKLDPQRSFVHLGPHGDKQSDQLGLPPFKDRAKEDRDKALVIAGHDLTASIVELVDHDVLYEAVFLRDPLAHLESRYNFRFRHATTSPPDFETWFESVPSDAQSRWLKQCLHLELKHPGDKVELFERLNERLEDFWLVGCTEHLDRLLPWICDHIGLQYQPNELVRRNVAGESHEKRYRIDAAFRDRIIDRHPLDSQLYDVWSRRSQLRQDVGESDLLSGGV